MSRKLILYIAMSLDGYIAKRDDNIDFLSKVEIPNEDYGYADFLHNIDTVIWGRRTFDKVFSFGKGIPHKDKKVFVISRTRTGNYEHVEFNHNLIGLVRMLKEQEGKDIYCDGGAEIVFQLLHDKLIDQLVVNIIPHILGEGIRLFKDGNTEQDITLKRTISYPSGLVQLWYDVRK